MSSTLSEDYLRWLAPQIRDEQDGLSNPRREFWGLLELMYEKEFVTFVPNDHNRCVDGLDLRLEFTRETRTGRRGPVLRAFLDRVHPDPPSSFLEVLIGLSRRVAFNLGGNAPGWAWVLLSNLDLHHMADPLTRGKARRANHILDRCIHREYAPDGSGGFFPLSQPQEDQTEVELWYQMAAYTIEIDSRER